MYAFDKTKSSNRLENALILYKVARYNITGVRMICENVDMIHRLYRLVAVSLIREYM